MLTLDLEELNVASMRSRFSWLRAGAIAGPHANHQDVEIVIQGAGSSDARTLQRGD